MLTNAQPDRLEVVLVSPRNPLNIGAAARAMANFGFARLTVVAPYEPHWREAKSAVGADELLQSARCTQCLAEAVADCALVIGTGTLAHRQPEQATVSLPDLGPYIERELAREGRIALVFGPEKRGLTRQDLSYCHLLAEIPTDPRQPSMNLGQAVAVCLYELAKQRFGPPKADRTPSEPGLAGLNLSSPPHRDASASLDSPSDRPCLAASSGQLDLLATAVEKTMTAVRYSPSAMHEANRHDLRLLLRRVRLTDSDAKRILGFFRRVLWRLEH